MVPEIWIAIIGLGSAVLGWSANIWLGSKGNKSADWQAYSDDLRQDNEEMRTSVNELQQQVNKLWAAVYDSNNMLNTALSHISVLERGIIDGSVPPLPERPFLLASGNRATMSTVQDSS